jgi:3'-phosphoadenosine 5'-phosphosulfate sulfotransferase (PAPS reductase)/FAD synthetase
MYEDSNGKPTKDQLKNLAKDTGLKLQQVYKWYWDTEKKTDQLQKEITDNDPEINSPMRLSRKILKTQYTDEFGGYSKTWFTDGLEKMRN